MRNYIIPAIILLLLIGGGIFEDVSLDRSVKQCAEIGETVIQKTEDQTAKEEDVLSFSDIWDKTKSRLHTYIPHTEIREVDMWLSEAKSFVATQDFELARAKLVVVRDKILSIPDSFSTTFGNVF